MPTPQTSLVRETYAQLRLHPPALLGLAISSSFCAGALALFVVLAPSPVHIHTTTINSSSPPPLQVATPSILEAECPPHIETTPNSIPLSALHLPWIGIAASAAGDAIALWTDQELYVSRDGGLRAQAINVEGTIEAVTVDVEERVWVLQTRAEKKLLVGFDAESQFANVPIPEAVSGDVEELSASSEGIVLVAWGAGGEDSEPYAPGMHVFDLETKEWKSHELPSWGNAGNSIVFAADGGIDMMGGSEASCGGGFQYHYRGSWGEEEWKEIAWPMDTPFGFVIGAEGWSYAFDDSCLPRDGETTHYTVCAASPEGELRPVKDAPIIEGIGDSFLMASAGKANFAAIDGMLVSLMADRFVTHAKLPGKVHSIEIDGRGRPLLLTESHVWTWTHQDGFQVIASRAAPASKD